MDLEEYILRLIQEKGLIGIDEFIEIALSRSSQSYYINSNPIGLAGDFTTAPEISQLFGDTIAIWIIMAWEKLNKPVKFNLIELGPGRGTLMFDVLKATKKLTSFFNSINKIVLVECSEKLAKSQYQKLQSFSEKTLWCKNLLEFNINLPSIVIANEFFDALPIKQYVKKANSWCEIMIGSDSKTILKFFERTLNDKEASFLNNDYNHLLDGDVIETSYESIKLIKHIIQSFQNFKGATLIIDYGYNRSNLKACYRSTLQAVKNHKYHPILHDIGKTDISSMVDFEQLILTLKNNYCLDYQYQTQRNFLIHYGILIKIKTMLNKISPSNQQAILSSCERLINPNQMGNLYKSLEFYYL